VAGVLVVRTMISRGVSDVTGGVPCMSVSYDEITRRSSSGVMATVRVFMTVARQLRMVWMARRLRCSGTALMVVNRVPVIGVRILMRAVRSTLWSLAVMGLHCFPRSGASPKGATEGDMRQCDNRFRRMPDRLSASARLQNCRSPD
jgi:hypothetical protein